MAGKAKGKKKAAGGSKKKAVSTEDPLAIAARLRAAASKPRAVGEADLLTKLENVADFVDVDLRVVNWAHANFTVRVRSCTTLVTLVRMVEERHGRVEHLRIFAGSPVDQNEVRDLHLSLASLGVLGGPRSEPARATLFYDFSPYPVSRTVLREPALMV